MSLLFTEMYLDRYFMDSKAFAADINAWIDEVSTQTLGAISFEHVTPDKLNKLAYMCATGTGSERRHVQSASGRIEAFKYQS